MMRIFILLPKVKYLFFLPACEKLHFKNLRRVHPPPEIVRPDEDNVDFIHAQVAEVLLENKSLHGQPFSSAT